MVRKLSWLVALLALNCSMGAFALGLGDISMHSGLNQPINADIELLSVRPADAGTIKVTLGSASDFERAGLDNPYVLNQLRFLVVASKKGHYRIHVSTEQAIREPFLDFLVQVTWRGGQLLREYTIMLDPPVLMPAPVQVITAPVTRAVASMPPAVTAPIVPVTTPSDMPKPVTQPSPPATGSAPEAGSAASPHGNEYGPVRPSQTLWSIANNARPDRSISVDQMMQAILRANPDAFINNNINNLKAGQILRIPDAAEVDAINSAKARAATLKQNEDWRGMRTAAPALAPKATPPAAQKSAPVSNSQGAQTPPQSEAQLKVLAPPRAATGSAGSGAATTTTAPSGTDVHKELALATEAVETQRQETKDLRTRMTDLEQQVVTMQKMMAIKDEQLAALQAKGAVALTAGAVPQAASGLSSPTSLVMIGIVAVVLAALLWLALRRRQLSTSVGMQREREIRVEPRQGPATPAPASRVAPTAATGAVAAAVAVRAANKNAEPRSGASPQEITAAAKPPPVEPDPLSEADIYLAYGRYQQAEDLIKEAMHHDRDPELRLKLLEIYYAAKNAAAFEDAARDLLHDVGAGHELWQRVLPMGRELCPYTLLFNENQGDAPPPTAAGGHTVATPDSYDFDASDSEATVLASGKNQLQPMHLDLEQGSETLGDTLDEVGTKLDLARAYIDMGDPDGARSILGEVLLEGTAVQQNEANELLQKLAR